MIGLLLFFFIPGMLAFVVGVGAALGKAFWPAISGWDEVRRKKAELAAHWEIAQREAPPQIKSYEIHVPASDDYMHVISQRYQVNKAAWINKGNLEDLWNMIDALISQRDYEYDRQWAEADNQNRLVDRELAGAKDPVHVDDLNYALRAKDLTMKQWVEVMHGPGGSGGGGYGIFGTTRNTYTQHHSTSMYRYYDEDGM